MYDAAQSLTPREGPELWFTTEEFDARLARVRALMLERDIDVLLVSRPANIAYLTGFETAFPSVFATLVVPLEAAVSVVCASVEVPNVARTTWVPLAQVSAADWLDGASTVGALASAIRGADGTSSVGAELSPSDAFDRGALDAATFAALVQALPEVAFVDASDLVLRARTVKSDAELQLMRRAAEFTELGLRAAADTVAAGSADHLAVSAAVAAMVAAGSGPPPTGPIVISGERTGWGSHLPTVAAPATDGPVFMELTASIGQYCAPALHTIDRGPSSRDADQLLDAIRETVRGLLEAIRPGRTGGDVAGDVRGHLAAVPGTWFHGAFGFSVGLAVPPTWTEAPLYLADGSNAELLPGMTFDLAICAARRGVVGVGTGMTVAVTPTGCEPLSSSSVARIWPE